MTRRSTLPTRSSGCRSRASPFGRCSSRPRRTWSGSCTSRRSSIARRGGSCSWAPPRAGSRSSRWRPPTPRRSSGSRRSAARPARLAGAGTGVRIGLGGHLEAAVGIAKGLVRTMLANDADLVEINPLAVVREGGPGGAEEGWSPSTRRSPSRRRRSSGTRTTRRCAIRTRRRPADAEARRHDIGSIHLDGTIGCMVNGAAWR